MSNDEELETKVRNPFWDQLPRFILKSMGLTAIFYALWNHSIAIDLNLPTLSITSLCSIVTISLLIWNTVIYYLSNILYGINNLAINCIYIKQYMAILASKALQDDTVDNNDKACNNIDTSNKGNENE